ncbi:HvfC/BufC N-terminal domain-containing protein [Actinomadura macra]|uniref:HvfC/BufC N-terminal domain-containing protein n=1 Tax=Actinomadura macra TaxID=46164 RepID=UPI00082E78CA|nr:DNA-binding domain-containing protein [Actinomadura macra]
MTSPPSLHAAQQWLLHAVTAPSMPADSDAAMLAGSDSLSASRRLEIHRRGYRRRLMETMRQGHPALRRLLGPDLFDAFAAGYLDARPPRSSRPARLGDRFAAHLEENRPDRDLPAGRREPWIDLMIDVVRYECLFTEVYDGPGPEEDPPGAWTWPPAEPPERVCAAPGVRLLRACAPVHRYHSAVHRGGRPAAPPLVPSHIVMFRRDYRVVTASPPPVAFVLLEALLTGAPLDEASARSGLDAAGARRHVRRWIAQRWVIALPALPGQEVGKPQGTTASSA